MQPDYLYHYTSISTLALILRNKKLRFNRLDKVDDLQEAKSADLGNLGRLFFVSCWSDSVEENIPLWSMYTNMRGVRIKLPSKMFKKYIIQPRVDGFFRIASEIESPIPYERMVTDKYIVNPTVYNFSRFLKEVEYTNDEDKLYPKIKSAMGDTTYLGTNDFGYHKRVEWRFQSEWRYILFLWPAPSEYKLTPNSDWLVKFTQELYSGIHNNSLPFDDFFVDLDESVLNKIEVTLGPKCGDGEKLIVDSLLSKYCSSGKIHDSSLRGNIG